MRTREHEVVEPKANLVASLHKKEEQEAETSFSVQNTPMHSLRTRFDMASLAQIQAKSLNKATALQSASAVNTLLQFQRSYGNHYIQRVIDMAKKGDDDTELLPDVEVAVQLAQGNGRMLDRDLQEQMESAFGADFSDVRIHTNIEADTLNRKLSARAFTSGLDIFFGNGEYRPESASGQKLLAHELTHVVQQNTTQKERKRFPAQTCVKGISKLNPSMISRQPQPVAQGGNRNQLVTFNGNNFRGAVTADAQFVDALRRVDNYAQNNNVTVVITDSFRRRGQVVANAIVQPANLGNHHAGHAIDMNVEYQGVLYNSQRLSPTNLRNLPQSVQNFIRNIQNDQGLRWGGNFQQIDPVHIDDGLNVNNPVLFQQRVQAVQPLNQQPATARGPVQPKLNVNRPGDSYELEADHISQIVIDRCKELRKKTS